MDSTSNKEQINHPIHYGGANNIYEAIKVIEAWQLDFNLGNTIKYISRAGKKDDTLQDLEKAKWYLDHKISQIKKTFLNPSNNKIMAKQTQKVVYLTIYRNSIDGQTCTKEYAEKNPDTTTKETRINIKPTLYNFILFANANWDLKGEETIEQFLK